MEIYILAGPNGAGKTTFAKKFIPNMNSIEQFVNADLIAAGLSPFNPDKEAIQAGKLMSKQNETLAKFILRGLMECLQSKHDHKSRIGKTTILP